MKKIIILNLVLLLVSIGFTSRSQNVGINDDGLSPDSKAILDVRSTSKGMLLPRLTTTQRGSITTPPSGLTVYDTETKSFWYYENSKWNELIKGGGTDGMTIQNDGSPLLNGTATAWNDLMVSPNTAKNSGTNVPGWTEFATTNIFTWTFQDGSLREVAFSVQLPHDYKEGTTIYPHVHWAPMTTATTNRVKWVLDYQWININSTFTDATSTNISGYLVIGDTGFPSVSLAKKQHAITPLGSGITGTGKTLSSILICRLYRDGADATNDTYTDNAAMLGVDFHYEVDGFGSRTEFEK